MREKDMMLDDICRLIEFESISSEPEGEYPFGLEVFKALEECLRICSRLGMKTKFCGKYTGYAEVGQGEKLIGILTHVDVVPAGDKWNTSPFKGVIKDGKLYGRGALDDKGPAVAAIYAIKDLMEEYQTKGQKLDKRVRIIFGCTEEKGEWKDIDYYLSTEEKPDMGFTPDADFPLIYAEKGIAEVLISFKESEGGLTSICGGNAVNMVPEYCIGKLKLENDEYKEIVGEGVSAHGSTPEEGENAISAFVHKVNDMNLEGICNSQFANFYEQVFGKGAEGTMVGLDISDDISGPVTVNPGLVYMEENVIKLHLDIRYPVTCTIEELEEKISSILLCDKFSENVKFSIVSDDKPMHIDKSSHLVKSLLEAYNTVVGEELEPIAIGGGTYAKSMDNIVAFGPVFPGRECTEHQGNEYILIDDLYKARQIYKEALKIL